MDHFLQLVPLENDSDAEQGLVYGEDEAVATHFDEQVQTQNHASVGFGTNSSSENVVVSAGETTPHDALHAFEVHDATDEHERQQYLARIESLNAHMQQTKCETQQRLDVMARILALTDPLEQLSEYMALKLDDERQDDHVPALDITSDLLECAKRLRSSEDSEVALLGAFFFACDPPPCLNNNRPRGVASMLPVVAAMMESAAVAAASGLEHPFGC